MEYLVKDLIEHLINKRNQELKNIEVYKQDDITEVILVASGKIMELDNIIHNLNEMLKYETHTR